EYNCPACSNPGHAGRERTNVVVVVTAAGPAVINFAHAPVTFALALPAIPGSQHVPKASAQTNGYGDPLSQRRLARMKMLRISSQTVLTSLAACVLCACGG